MDLNYVDKIVAQLGQELDDVRDTDLLRYYALLVLVLGVNTTEEDVHDAWSVWRTATDPDHRSLVRFSELTAQVQAMDTKYVLAIRSVAQETWGPPWT